MIRSVSASMAEDFLAGGGEMGERIRALDWAATPVGPPGRWPENLRAALGICLNSRFPMYVWWGPDLTLFYNAAYISFLPPPSIRSSSDARAARPGRRSGTRSGR